MELRLNIYKGNDIEKTYIANDFRLMTGTCEDVLNLVNIDKLGTNFEDEAFAFEIFKVVLKAFNQFNPLMKQIFEGLTDEEYRRTDIKEVAMVVRDVIKFTIGQLFTVASKN